jgi:hypothetical protein
VRSDAVLTHYLLDAPEVRGVDDMDVSSLTFTMRVRTRPAMQWTVERRLREAAHTELVATGTYAGPVTVGDSEGEGEAQEPDKFEERGAQAP